MPTANEELLHRGTSHQIGLIRLSTGLVRRIVAHLNKVEPDLRAQIARRLELIRERGFDLGPATTRRLQELERAVRDILAEGHSALQADLREELVNLAAYEAEFQGRMIQAAVPIRLEVVQPARNTLRSVVTSRPIRGRFLRDWAKQLERNDLRRVMESIRIGISEGETVDQMIRRVVGSRTLRYKDGAREVTRRGAEFLVRTSTNHVTTQAREQLYAENQGLIKGVEWVSTLDSKTTHICMARDGKVYKPNQGPRPPGHGGCRSTTAPVVKSWRELGIDLDEAPAGTRASMDGQVAADRDYQAWLSGKGAVFQDEVLGVTKGRLFRDGGLRLDRMVDMKTGREFTLAELRRREETAFARAGL